MTLNDHIARPVTFPSESRIAHLYARPDLADAYAIRLPDDAITDPEAPARFVFAQQPPWVPPLMRTRDAVMAWFGVKTSRQLKAGNDRSIAIFRIYERGTHEVILGQNDRHLDFRLSVLRTGSGDAGACLTPSTVVRCHNRLGRVYLIAIAPFHRMIVKSYLNRAARIGWPRLDVEAIA